MWSQDARPTRLKGLLSERDVDFHASVLFIDIDDFKKVNDTFTHTVGDAVLVELSVIFMQQFRSWDIIGRWGGEEFLAILPGSRPDESFRLAEQVRRMVEKHDWASLTGELPVTISIGLVSLTDSFPVALEDVIVAVGEKLKVAKATGKNRVVAG